MFVIIDAEINEYYQTPKGKAVKEFVEQEYQDAIVYGVVQDYVTRTMDVECYSPVWKTVNLVDVALRDVKRGDIISLMRYKEGRGMYNYRLVRNKTTEKIKQDGIDEILKGFDSVQRSNIYSISANQKVNEK